MMKRIIGVLGFMAGIVTVFVDVDSTLFSSWGGDADSRNKQTQTTQETRD